MILEDIPKLYTALAEWLSCLLFVLLLRRRWNNKKTIVLMSGSLVLLCIVQYLIGVLPLFLWIPGMILALIIMYGTIFVTCELTALDAGFYWALAFICAEFVASLDWQLYSFVVMQWGDHLWVQAVLLILCYGGFFMLFFLLERKRIGRKIVLNVTRKEFCSALIISVGAFLISNISYIDINTPLSGHMSMEIFYIRTLVDFSGVIMLVSLQRRWQDILKQKEMESINTLLQHQYDQYRRSQENIDLVNRKYHDLKHQIAIIRMEQDEARREEYLRQLESGVTDMVVRNQTGSQVLDTILSGKQMYCMQNKIELNVVADGKQLGFIEEMDLCSLFGNALDNAIESVEQLEQPKKRLIRLAVYVQNNFLMIRVENYFESPIRKIEDEFKTTKKDSHYHGYGIKSIRYTVEKYGGSVGISTEEHWFSLRILIPIPR